MRDWRPPESAQGAREWTAYAHRALIQWLPMPTPAAGASQREVHNSIQQYFYELDFLLHQPNLEQRDFGFHRSERQQRQPQILSRACGALIERSAIRFGSGVEGLENQSDQFLVIHRLFKEPHGARSKRFLFVLRRIASAN